MKKICLIIVLMMMLCGCNVLENKTESLDSHDRYLNFIEIIKQNESYVTKSDNFDLSAEMARIENGYRYYVTIDNAKTAMYDIEAIAIEKDVNYEQNMAANIGIFEESKYNMIPNQSNPEDGFVKGLVMSGISEKDSTTLYVLVQWKRSDLSTTYREIFKLDVSFMG